MPAVAELPATDTRTKLLLRLAREAVDTAGGIIKGVTVAKANVRALGKVVLLDAHGQRTFDEKLAVKKLPVFTDAKTLTTLLAAAKIAGARIKAREDHNDSLEARIGYAFEVRAGGENNELVAADLKVFENYRNRDLLFETALETPDQVGISIDFDPEFEFTADRALMRVKKLEAIDVVDAGAITPEGLLLSSVDVDTEKKETATQLATESQPTEHMAAPTLEEIMSAVTKMTDGYAALAKQVTECQAALAKFTAPPAAADSEMKALKEANTQLSAKLDTIEKSVKATTDALTAQRKERALLGLRATDAERVQLAGKGAEEIEALAAKQKNYLQLVDDRVATDKCSRSEAHSRVQRTDEGQAAYRLHLNAKGVVTEKAAA